MMLSVARRQNKDGKTIRGLFRFFCLMDETGDIAFSQSMRIILETLMDTVAEYLHITEGQLAEFTAGFIAHLSKYMQDALQEANAAA